MCYWRLSPTKGDWCPHQCLRFILLEPPSRSFIKVLHQILSILHVSCRYPSGIIIIICSLFHQVCIYFYLFIWGSYPWWCPFILYSKWPTRSGGGLINCLRLGHKVSFSNGFSNETWNDGRTLILAGNYNFSMSLTICSTIGHGAPSLNMYQPKATTLACVLIRMVALWLILA